MKFRKWCELKKSSAGYTTLEDVYQFLSTELGIKSFSVRQWSCGSRQVSAKYVLPLEKLTNGQVKRHEMRVDLYPVEN
jgi:DNA-binding transcriptional regulator YdaS (Cro superfamily)